MILTPHILVGATLGANIANPMTVAAGAMALHFALDAVPHWDYDIYSSKKSAAKKIAADIFSACLILIVVIWKLPLEKQLLILAGGFFGVLPDGLLFLNIVSKNTLFSSYTKFHNFWHRLIVKKGHKPPILFGVLPQIIVITISIYTLINVL